MRTEDQDLFHDRSHCAGEPFKKQAYYSESKVPSLEHKAVRTPSSRILFSQQSLRNTELGPVIKLGTLKGRLCGMNAEAPLRF